MKDDEPRIRMRDVTLRAGGRTLVDSVTLEIHDGPPTVILGPNGAGKSLLLRIMHGLVRPTAGEVWWRGGSDHDPVRSQAFVFQRPVLLRRSVRANVEFPLAVRGVDAGRRAARSEEALRMVGLAHLARAPARALSIGEQQRLALARAWVVEPEVLLLDEPTASLDVAASAAVEALVTQFRDRGVKVILTTHDLAQARRLAGDVVFLHHGRVVERNDARRFFGDPDAAETRAFLEGRRLA